ncbi:IMP dehydrogenase, partial [Candidatus Bathyarchaeota archaeon]|nr:IMP dehydrogenase [Candidatus Bathyarchaeota archaeon]
SLLPHLRYCSGADVSHRGLKAAMGYVGARTIPEMWEKARLALVTERGADELKPHDILLPGSEKRP